MHRRDFIHGLGGLSLALAVPRLSAGPIRFEGNPFTLGVASGYPLADGFVLWTRLAPEPLAPGGGLGPMVYPVSVEVAEDEKFRKIIRKDTVYASPVWGHAVHAEISGLLPNRWYWYRFHVGPATSPIGRTRTAPAMDQSLDRLRFAACACQQYEQGFYAAYRHMVDDQLDLIVHLGDYIYESSWGKDHVRKHEGPEPITLDDYRARYARYKLDPDLQAAHAHYPWILTWDDHEVENDYAADRSENDDEPGWFLKRRAAAYQAYYEHLPLRQSMIPLGPDLRLHTRVGFGSLINIHLLDDRQYRSPQPCPKPGRAGSNRVESCEDRLRPELTLLGARQERWLEAGLADSPTRWNVLAQQTLMAQADAKAGPGIKIYTDGWDGYPLARRRLLDTLGRVKPANPVVLSGDVHAFWVNDLRPDFDDPLSPIVASEFVCGSITSQSPSEEMIQTQKNEGAHHVRFATGLHRGYARFEVSEKNCLADLRVITDVKDPKSECRTLTSWAVEAGRSGVQQA